MNTYISMLRGVNVSGQKKINMKKLSEIYESLGFKNVKTYIQSGNVVFQYIDMDFLKLAKKIEDKIKKDFGFDVLVFIRSSKEMEKLIKNNPFHGKDEDRIYVIFSNGEIKNPNLDEIKKIKGKNEEFFISGKEIYLFLPDGYGTTKLNNNFFERKLKINATTRNWNTVNALSQMGIDL